MEITENKRLNDKKNFKFDKNTIVPKLRIIDTNAYKNAKKKYLVKLVYSESRDHETSF